MENKDTQYISPPKGIIENCIADCWQELLVCNRPERLAILNDLSNDTNVAPELLKLIQKRYGFLATNEFMQNEYSIASISKSLVIDNNFIPQPLVTLRDDKEGPRLIFVPGFAGNAWNYQELAKNINTPCAIEAINIDSYSPSEHKILSLDEILDSIVQCLSMQNDERPIWIGGYSFGGFIASNLAQKLSTRINLKGIILLDPRPLNKLRLWSFYQKVLSYKITNYLSDNTQDNSPQRFEKKMQFLRLLHRKKFRGFKVELPKIKTKILMSEKISSEYPPSRYMTIDPTLCKISEFDIEHLDILRLPLVNKTARWIEAVVS